MTSSSRGGPSRGDPSCVDPSRVDSSRVDSSRGRVAALGECMVEVALGRDGKAGQVGFGGDTLNTAVYLARGAGSALEVYYVTALGGEDPFSQQMVQAWQSEGVRTELVRRMPDRLPGLYTISTDARAERTFHYWREQAAARSLFDDGFDIRLRDALHGFDLLYFSGISIAILAPAARQTLFDLLTELSAGGSRIAFDSNYRPRLWASVSEAREVTLEFARLADVVLPSADDEAALFGDVSPEATAERWFAEGIAEVVVKDGAGPLWMRTEQGCYAMATAPVTQVVDTTAAGDSFNGAYLYRRLAGDEPAVAARAGQRLAAKVIGQPGALIDIA